MLYEFFIISIFHQCVIVYLLFIYDKLFSCVIPLGYEICERMIVNQIVMNHTQDLIIAIHQLPKQSDPSYNRGLLTLTIGQLKCLGIH